MQLTSDQLKAVQTISSLVFINAGPGAGKSKTIVERIRYLIETGTKPSEILAITFTNKAAKVMQDRLSDMNIHGVTASTMHALAVRLKIRDGNPFSIFDEDDCYSIIKKLAKVKKIVDKDELYDISNEIALLKDNQIPFIACSSKYRDILLSYEEELNNNNAIDFADLITILISKTGKDYIPWRHILVDEVQDLSNGQISVIKNFFERREEKDTLTLCGDLDQCQPMDTKIRLGNGEIKTLGNLEETDTLQSFDRHSSHIFKKQKIVKQTRFYYGLMYDVSVGDKSARSTYNHKWPIRLIRNETNKNLYCTYIMKQGQRYRVGQCLVYGSRSAGFGFSVRCRIENADEAWILSTYNTLEEAKIQETILSVKYGIPQTCFQGHIPGFNQSTIDKIFNGLDLEQVALASLSCLRDHNRNSEYPFWKKQTWAKYEFRTSHECQSCNLIPGIMYLPIVDKNNKVNWELITDIAAKETQENVVSLDVERYHTYILENGMVTCNSVYEWRNAKPGIIKKFAEENAEIISLAINFRSTKSIVNYSKRLISLNKIRIIKPLEAHSKEIGIFPKTRCFSDSLEEAEWVADLCSKSKDICILYRSNWMSTQIELALTKAKINYTVSDTVQFLDRKEIKDVLSYIRVAINGNDMVSLTRSIQSPKRGIGKKTLEDIKKFEDIIDNDKMQDYVSIIYNLRERKVDAGYAIRGMLFKSNYLGYEDEPERIRNLDQLITILEGKTLEEAMFELTGGSPTSDDSDSRIHLMTFHSSKGTEYKKVVIIGCEEGITPHINSENLEEERRLFYVGMTRAENELILSYTRKRLMYGSYNYMQPSKFIKEAGISF